MEIYSIRILPFALSYAIYTKISRKHIKWTVIFFFIKVQKKNFKAGCYNRRLTELLMYAFPVNWRHELILIKIVTRCHLPLARNMIICEILNIAGVGLNFDPFEFRPVGSWFNGLCSEFNGFFMLNCDPSEKGGSLYFDPPTDKILTPSLYWDLGSWFHVELWPQVWILRWFLTPSFNLKWNFFGKRWDESLLIFRLYVGQSISNENGPISWTFT